MYSSITKAALLLLGILSLFACQKEVVIEQHDNYKGKFIDTRDGQKYPIIQLGEQLWMAENIRFVVDSQSREACYWPNKAIDQLSQKGGLFYSWEGAQQACPDGWRLPQSKDFQQLFAQYTTTELLHQEGWQQTPCKEETTTFNTTAFSALPTGFIKQTTFVADEEEFQACSMGRSVNYWLQMPSPTYASIVCQQYQEVTLQAEDNPLMPCRCIKDLASDTPNP